MKAKEKEKKLLKDIKLYQEKLRLIKEAKKEVFDDLSIILIKNIDNKGVTFITANQVDRLKKKHLEDCEYV